MGSIPVIQYTEFPLTHSVLIDRGLHNWEYLETIEIMSLYVLLYP